MQHYRMQTIKQKTNPNSNRIEHHNQLVVAYTITISFSYYPLM